MLLHEFWKLVDETTKKNPSWRYGQAAFNVLCDVRPELSERVRGSIADPFHVQKDRNNGHWQNFVNFLNSNWTCPDCGTVPMNGACSCGA